MFFFYHLRPLKGAFRCGGVHVLFNLAFNLSFNLSFNILIFFRLICRLILRLNFRAAVFSTRTEMLFIEELTILTRDPRLVPNVTVLASVTEVFSLSLG